MKNKNKYAVVALGAIIATTGITSTATANEHGKGWRMHDNDERSEMGEHQGKGKMWGKLKNDDDDFRGSHKEKRGEGREEEMEGKGEDHSSEKKEMMGEKSEMEKHTMDFSSYPLANLTQDEKDALVHMREEEKLARDVYRTLSKTTDSRAFVNIPVSEQRHMDVFAQLIDRYGLIDPVKDESQIGLFTNNSFTEKFTELTNKGKISDKDAFEAGAMVEDINMFNLLKYKAATDKPDLQAAYEQLFEQSQHHMSAFIRNLEKMGATYTPEYISIEQLNDAVNSGKKHMQDEANQGGEKAQEMEHEIENRHNDVKNDTSAIQGQIRSLQTLLQGLLQQLIALLSSK